MITLDSLKNLKTACETISALAYYAEECVFDKPMGVCFIPLMDLIAEGWDKYEETHPNTPIFKNGVYINDDSAYLGEAIVYAAKNIDVSKLLPESCLKCEEIVGEFRYDLADTIMRYFRFFAESPKPYLWNEHTINWDNVWDIVEIGEKYGKTLCL